MRWNLGVAGLAASWGLIAIIVAGLDLEAAVLVFYRLGLAALAIGAVAAAARRSSVLRPPARSHRVLVLGAMLAVHWFLFFQTLKLASVAVAVLLVYTAPVLLALLAPFALPERRSRAATAALVPAGVGLAAIALGSGEEAGATPVAIACGLGAALSYAALVIATKRVAATVHTATITFWTYATASVILAPFLLGAERLLPRGAEIAYVLLLGVVFTALSGFVYITLLRRVTAQAVGVLAYLEPVSAAVLAWAILGEPLTAAVVVGGALVVVGGLLVVLAEPGDAAPVEAPPLRLLPSGAERD